MPGISTAPLSDARDADHRALNDLLSRDAAEWLARGQLPGRGDTLVLVGAGQLGREVAHRLGTCGRPPAAFLDETPTLDGTSIDGVPVLGLRDAVARYGRRAWFAVTIWSAGHSYLVTRGRLAASGCTRVCSFLDLAWSEPDVLLPHYAFDLPHATVEEREPIERVFGLLADQASRRHFLAHLRFRLTRDYSELPAPASPAYLAPDVLPRFHRVTYVDGGAHHGVTLREFLRHHGQALVEAHMFEPDPVNHARLVEAVARLDAPIRSRVRCHRAALSSRDGTERLFAHGGAASAIAPTGREVVESRRLDSVLGEAQNGPVLIKLDVEGHEARAIRGAERTIRKRTTCVVACLYHRPRDLWAIPLLLHGYRPDLRFYIRTEGTDGAGVVCYAVPSSA